MIPAYWLLLFSLAPLPILAAAIGAGLARRTALDRSLKLALAAAGCSLAATLAMEILRSQGRHNLYIANLYGLSLGLWPLAMAWRKAQARWGFLAVAGLLAAAWLAFILRAGTLHRFNGPALSTAQFIVLGCALCELASLALEVRGPMTRQPWIWISSSLMIEGSAVLLLLALNNRLIQVGIVYHRWAWTVNSAASIFASLLLRRAFLCPMPNSKPFGSSS